MAAVVAHRALINALPAEPDAESKSPVKSIGRTGMNKSPIAMMFLTSLLLSFPASPVTGRTFVRPATRGLRFT